MRKTIPIVIFWRKMQRTVGAASSRESLKCCLSRLEAAPTNTSNLNQTLNLIKFIY